MSAYACDKISNICLCLKPALISSHQVHPSGPTGPKHSDFIEVDRNKTVRVIHVKPQSQNIPRISYENDKRLSVSRLSLTEEYWFTRWNKPLRGAACNCSFRRSQRYSKLTDQFSSHEIEKKDYNTPQATYDLPATKIVNVETFVDRLMQDTYFEALQEYLISRNNAASKPGSGIDNFAFKTSVDDIDGVVLRRKTYNKQPAVLPVECITNQPVRNDSLSSHSFTRKCLHRKSNKKKPMVMLLHGIGSTADVWWNLINKLQKTGFEIIAPDMLGHGYSSAPNQVGPYKFKNILRYTLEVFDHYIHDEMKAIVIGHSYGCSLATALARYRIQHVEQLVLISGGGPTPLAAPVEVNEAGWCDWTTLARPLIYCGLKRSLFYSSRGKHHKPCETTHGIPEYVLKNIERGQSWPEGDAVFHRRILIPTLLVHGLQDTNVTLVQECEMERTIPRAFLELIPNAGHMSILETPEHLGHMITCFLDWWSR